MPRETLSKSLRNRRAAARGNHLASIRIRDATTSIIAVPFYSQFQFLARPLSSGHPSEVRKRDYPKTQSRYRYRFSTDPTLSKRSFEPTRVGNRSNLSAIASRGVMFT